MKGLNDMVGLLEFDLCFLFVLGVVLSFKNYMFMKVIIEGFKRIWFCLNFN